MPMRRTSNVLFAGEGAIYEDAKLACSVVMKMEELERPDGEDKVFTASGELLNGFGNRFAQRMCQNGARDSTKSVQQLLSNGLYISKWLHP